MTYVIAEIGNNHNGDVKKCLKFVERAAKVGADAIKVQSFRGLDIVAPNILASEYPDWDSGGKTFWYEFLDTIALPLDAHEEVIEVAGNLGLDFITTPVSSEIVSILEGFKGIRAYKVASMDLNNLDLLQALANTGKPIILSTGMGSFDEVLEATKIFEKSELSILHCISDYPLNPIDAALTNIVYLKKNFKNLKIGFSDHSLGHELAVAAVAMGAEVIEKHFTLNRSDPDPAEHHMSMEPDEFSEMVSWIRSIDKNFENTGWNRSATELEATKQYRRSFHYKKKIPSGTVVTMEHLAFIRPGVGLDYGNISLVLGRNLTRDAEPYSPCLQEDFE